MSLKTDTKKPDSADPDLRGVPLPAILKGIMVHQRIRGFAGVGMKGHSFCQACGEAGKTQARPSLDPFLAKVTASSLGLGCSSRLASYTLGAGISRDLTNRRGPNPPVAEVCVRPDVLYAQLPFPGSGGERWPGVASGLGMRRGAQGTGPRGGPCEPETFTSSPIYSGGASEGQGLAPCGALSAFQRLVGPRPQACPRPQRAAEQWKPVA